MAIVILLGTSTVAKAYTLPAQAPSVTGQTAEQVKQQVQSQLCTTLTAKIDSIEQEYAGIEDEVIAEYEATLQDIQTLLTYLSRFGYNTSKVQSDIDTLD